jgi:hypothetical protein
MRVRIEFPMRPITAARSLDLTGGESVYCINEAQLANARRLADEDSQSATRIRKTIDQLETDLSRNERAAVAFLLIERLRIGST